MINFDDVSLRFGDTPILSKIDFTVSGPGLTVLFGESGQGKSTILKLATGQIPIVRAPHRGGAFIRGEIRIMGEPIEAWRPHELCRTIGHCLQEAVMLPGSVGYNLLHPHKVVRPGVSKAERVLRAEDALVKVGLASDVRLKTAASALSGGQKQRLSIARALMLEPKAIFLDEPTSALDGVAAANVVECVLKMSKAQPVIVVTHDEKIARLSDRVLFLGRPSGEGEGARILADGPPEAVFGAAAHPELTRIVTAFDRL